MQTTASAQYRTDRDQYILVGTVLEVTYETADLDTSTDPPTEGPRRTTGITRFDKTGKVLEVISYSRGRAVLRSVYSRDSDGNKIATQYRVANGTTVDRKATNPAWMTTPTARFLTTSSYDPQTRTTTEKNFRLVDGGSRVLSEGYRFVFDNHGRLAESTQFDLNEDTINTFRYVYANGGQLPSRDYQFNAEGKVTITADYEYQFDSAGNWTRRVVSTQLEDDAVVKTVQYATMTYR